MSYWQNKAALVTGGSAGLGLAIAEELVRSGAAVVIAARDRQRLDAAVARLQDLAPSRAESASNRPAVVGIAADITQQAQVEALVAESIARHGKLDLLVNCAGKSARGAIEQTTAEQFEKLLALNFLALVRCTRACLPHLVATRGHVVHIGSLASKTAAPYLGAYPASKFPVASYAQQLRLELGPKGLHVLLVCPGPICREDAGRRYEEAAALPPGAHLPGGGAKLSLIDPHWLARRILAACQRRQPELVVPGRARLLFAISQLWPRLGDWLLMQSVRR
jgi:short-subunit dehydrogenase